MRKQKINVLRGAQDFIVIGKSGRDSYVYAVKPSLDVQKQFYEASISNPEDADIPVFQRYWKFNEEQGIRGSSAFLALRLDQRALRPNGLWIPGLLEAKVLESQGKLENGLYRDNGITVYSDAQPNKEVAETLIPQAAELDLELPLVVPFRALDYAPTRENGLDISFAESPKGIISGKEAQDKISSFYFKENFGVHGLGRFGYGCWVAHWDKLDDSCDGGRVDWVCGEATHEILEKAHPELSERKYGERIKELREEQKSENAKFRESLKR